MTTEPTDIAKELAQASPELAASIWTTVAEDRHLAIMVHEALGQAGRVDLAHKLGELEDRSTKRTN